MLERLLYIAGVNQTCPAPGIRQQHESHRPVDKAKAPVVTTGSLGDSDGLRMGYVSLRIVLRPDDFIQI